MESAEGEEGVGVAVRWEGEGEGEEGMGGMEEGGKGMVGVGAKESNNNNNKRRRMIGGVKGERDVVEILEGEGDGDGEEEGRVTAGRKRKGRR